MTTVPHPDASSNSIELTGTGPLLIGTEGTRSSDGAIELALAMAKGLDDVFLLAVHEPFAIASPEAQLVLSGPAEAARRAELIERVVEQVNRIGHPELRPRVEIADGEPAARIVEKATELDARLVVVGLGRHEIIDRMFGDESALKLVRRSRISVLAVPEVAKNTLCSAVVAIDFSDASIRSAQMAASLMEHDGTVHLVHVIPKERGMLNWWVPATDYEAFLEKSFAWLRAHLSIPDGVAVSNVTLTGDPATKLLRYADEIEADLVAGGSHGHGFFARLVVGSVTTKLLRGAKCSVLVVPRDAVIADLPEWPMQSPTSDRAPWS